MNEQKKSCKTLEKYIQEATRIILGRNSEYFIQWPLYSYQIAVVSNSNRYKIMKMLFHWTSVHISSRKSTNVVN